MILLHRLYAHHFKQLVDVTLHLPAQGTVLIEGHNEAGKSSLFEAVFFALYGQPLISERDYKLEHLRNYGAEALEVELDFSIDGRRFSVARRIGKNHTVKLVAPTENGEAETISIRSEVSRRLHEELRLSAEALLNTCFVEQKRLERLEDLNAEARKMTINELLNLRVLTGLEAEFKITREDRDFLQSLKGRLSVARLDAALPALQEREQQSVRCLLFTQLCEVRARWEQLQRQIAVALEQQAHVKEQRAHVTRDLECHADLKARLNALDSDLKLRAGAWQAALEAHEAAAAHVRELENLAAALPERKAHLQARVALLDRLVELEGLESEAARLRAELPSHEARLARHDEVRQAWEAGQSQRADLAADQASRQTELESAQAHLAERQVANERAGRLALLLQHVSAHENMAREVEELASRVRQAREVAQNLEPALARRAALEDVEQRLHRQEQQQRELSGAEAEASRLCRDLGMKQAELAHYDAVQQSWDEGQARRVELDTLRQERARELNEAGAQVAAREAAYRRDGQLTLLLQHAVVYENLSHEVAELGERLDAARTRAADLPAQRERLQALEEAGQRLRRRDEDQRSLHHIEAELAAARRKQGEAGAIHAKLDELGARRTEAQARLDAAAQRVAAATRRATPGWVLTAFGVVLCLSGIIAGPVPGAVGLLLILLGAFLMIQARAADGAARADQAAARSESDALSGEWRATQAQLQMIDTRDAAELDLEVQQLAASRDRLSHALHDERDVTALLQDLGVDEDVASVQKALEMARHEVAEGSAALRFAQDLEQQQMDKAQQTSEALHSLRSYAAQLALTGTTPAEWKASAHAAREALHVERQATPDEALQAQLDHAREAVAALDHHRAHLDGEQSRHRAQLDARPRADIARELEVIERAVDANKTQREILAASIGAADLPRLLQSLGVAEDSASLHTAVQAARGAVAECEATAATVAPLEHQWSDKARQVREEAARVQALAAELSVAASGATMAEWQAMAAAEHATWQAQRHATPDTALSDRVEQARRAVNEIAPQSALLEREQARRNEELSDRPRPQLEAELRAIQQLLVDNEAQQAPLAAVRPALAQENLPSTAPALRTRLEVERARVEHDESRTGELPSTRAAMTARSEALTARALELAQAWTAILDGEPVPEGPQQALSRLHQLREVTEQGLLELDEPRLRIQADDLQKADILLGEEIATRRHQQDELRPRQQELLNALGAAEEDSPEGLPARFPELLAAHEHDINGWEQAVHERREAVRDNRSLRAAHAGALGVGEDLLDLAEAEAALSAAEKNLAVKRRAGEIVTKTRHSIVSRVMPLTLQNMSQLLPLLTEGRYHDVQWDEASNVLSVYDTRARDYQRKRVFSGGARDQISLALRLAFALATLPGEHNVRPGWLFLDEPLSSFDRSRTQALVDLLTRGLIRRQFAQIFLVSHSESFDPAQFDYRLRMADGRVLESTLPTPESQKTQREIKLS